MSADDLYSLTSGTLKLRPTENVPVQNKDDLVITQILYFYKASEVLKVNAQHRDACLS